MALKRFKISLQISPSIFNVILYRMCNSIRMRALQVITIGPFKSTPLMSRSLGLAVMGGDPCSEGHVFESQHCIPDGHFFTYLTTINGKRDLGWCIQITCS